MKSRFLLTVGLSTVAVAACEQQLPVGLGEGALPGEPVTLEVLIPWSDFASALEVFGGYGSPRELQRGILALDYQDTLQANTLVRLGAYPAVASVRDSTGTLRPDSALTYIGGRLVAFFDTIASTNEGPVRLSVSRTQTEWDARTASWTYAVDTINDQRPWPEPGGGPVAVVDTAEWDPATGDSVVFTLDSLTVAAWADASDRSAGARIEMVAPGERLRMRSAALRLDARATLDPDTLLVLTAAETRDVTFIYSPFPEPPPDGIRIGGAPSWRTILDVAIPEVLTGPPEFCAVVSCPHTVEPGQISFAALVLTSRATDPAFQPTDSIRLDVRPVFDRSAMPKSPLGNSLIEDLFGRPVSPDAFGATPGARIEIPFTTFARDLLRGEDEAGNPAPNTLALLSVLEPFSLSFASFSGPGTPDEPVLRLVLTIGPPVELP